MNKGFGQNQKQGSMDKMKKNRGDKQNKKQGGGTGGGYSGGMGR